MAKKNMKDEIVKSLLDTSFSRSVGATSLTDIASNLNIKKASLYNHFDSREDIISETTATCKNYIGELTFVPNNLDEVAKKYPVESVLKGIVQRYFKMHEKSPLFQIYTYVQSQKYFDADVASIVTGQNEKLVEQTQQVLTALAENGKISTKRESIPVAAQVFVAKMNQLLEQILAERKTVVMSNPQTGEGELFTIPADDTNLDKVVEFTDQFANLLK